MHLYYLQFFDPITGNKKLLYDSTIKSSIGIYVQNVLKKVCF